MWVNFIFALIPIVWLVVSLTALKMPAARAGIFPIVYIIVAAMFTSKVTFKSGAMQKIQDMLCSLTTDKRILVLLIAWGFWGP